MNTSNWTFISSFLKWTINAKINILNMSVSHKLDTFLYLLLPCFFQIKIYVQCKNLIELKEKEIIVRKRIKFFHLKFHLEADH